MYTMYTVYTVYAVYAVYTVLCTANLNSNTYEYISNIFAYVHTQHLHV